LTSKRSLWLLAALLSIALLAGCGSSSSSSTTTTGGQTNTATQLPATTPTTSGGSPNSSIVQAAVAACRAGIEHAAVSASVKTKLEGICNKAASGDLNGAREAAKKVCVEIVNSQPVSGKAKEEALAICNRETAP
jgi:hypothetical protein